MSIVDWGKRTWNNIVEGYSQFNTSKQSVLPGLMWDLFWSDKLTEDQQRQLGMDPSKSGVSRAFSRSFNHLQTTGSSLGKALSSAQQVPILGDILRAYDRVFTYGVKRPATTALRVGFLADEAGAEADSFGKSISTAFNPETWNRAWNDSERVTPGQQFMANAAVSFQGVTGNEGGYTWDDFDPATPEGRARYYEDPLFQGVSGTLDFGFAFIDPLKGGTKLGALAVKGTAGTSIPGVARLAERTVSVTGMAPTAKMLDKGFLEREAFGPAATVGSSLEDVGTLSPSYEKLFQAARSQDLNTFQRLYFNDGAFGGTVGLTVWSVARQGDKGVFADALMAARGSRDAWQRMQTAAPAVANAIGRQRQALNFASAVDQYGQQASAKQAVDSATDAQMTEWVDSFGRELETIGTKFENAESFWYGYQGSLEGQGIVRASILDKIRVGLHQYSTSNAPVSFHWGGQTIGRVARSVTRFVNPSSRYDSLVDVNAVNSYRNFRYNVERSVLGPVARNELVQRYMLAATPEARSAIIAEADGRALNGLLSRYNIPKSVYNDLLPELQKLRGAGMDMLSRSTKHIPEEFRKAANQARVENRKADAARMDAYAAEWQKLVDEGQVPDVLNALPAGERGYLGLAANMGGFKSGSPFMRSTTANLMPMMDYRALELSVRRYMAPIERTRKRLEQAELSDIEKKGSSHLTDLVIPSAWYAKQATAGFLKSIQSVWAIAALLRPAQFIRSLADDGMRAMVWHGTLPYFLTGMRGTARLAYKVGTRGVTWAQEWGSRRVAVLQNRTVDVDIPDIDLPPLDAPSPFKDTAPGFYQIQPRVTNPALYHVNKRGKAFAADFDTFEEALAKGVLPAEFYTEYVKQAVDEGRAPWSLVAYKEQLDEGTLSQEQFNRRVYEYALDQAGISAYTNPNWQRDFYDAVKGSSKGVLADPLNGGAGAMSRPKELYDKYDSGPTFLVKVDATNGMYRFDDLYDFLSPHAKMFVESGYLVHGIRTASGDLQVTLVRRRDAPRTVAERMTAAQRKDMLDGIKRVGQEDIRMRVGGVDTRVKGAFAGMEGDWLKTAVSSMNDTSSTHAATLSLKNTSRQIMKSGATDTVRPSDKNYPESWEYTANKLVANDPVMRLVLEGKSYSEILAWTMTPRGEAWVASRQQKGAGVADHVQQLVNMATKVVPDIGDMRARALVHNVTFKELEQAIPDIKDRPQVLGIDDQIATGKNAVVNWVSDKVNAYFRVMNDMPIDRLVRYPFAETEYRNVLTPLMENYQRYLKRTGGHFDPLERERLQHIARQQTLDTMQQVLYDTAGRTDAAAAMQMFMPFSNAIADSYFKWMRLAWKKPLETTAAWWRYWGAPDRAGLVYDQDGYHLSIDADGNEVWTDPVTGEVASSEDQHGEKRKHDKHVLFVLPELGGKQAFGKDGKFFGGFNKDSMNPILGVPTAGPIVALPANKFLIDKPLLADNYMVKTFVLPFGVTDDNIAQQASPGWVRTFTRWMTENQDMASSTAMQIYQMQLVEYAKGERVAKPSINEAKKQAENELGMRFLSSLFSPVSNQYYNPYKPFTDYYHMLLEKHKGNEQDAMMEFRKVAGDEYNYMAAHISKANVSLPATKGAYRRFQESKELIEKYPDLAGLIIGDDGAGSFNKAVYEWEKTLTVNGKPVREVVSIKDSIADIDKRTTWDEYTKLNMLIKNELENRGLTSLKQQGALDLAAARDGWVESKRLSSDGTTISEWYKDYMSTDQSVIEGRLTALRTILQDRNLVERRLDLQGLQQYIYERDRMKQLMEGYQFSSLSSQRASFLAERWFETVSSLTGRNQPFLELYTRWLDKDDLSDPGGVPAEEFEGVDEWLR